MQMYKTTTILHSQTRDLPQDFQVYLTSSRQMNDLKDNSLPKISTKTPKISVAFGDDGANRVASLLGENKNFVLTEKVVRRPMTAITVTRRGEIKHKVVSAPVKDSKKKSFRIQDVNHKEMLVLFPTDHQKTLQQGQDLGSQNELSNNTSKLTVLQPLDKMKARNGRLHNRNKNFQKSTKDFCGCNINGAMTKESQNERLPRIGKNDLRTTSVIKDRGIELQDHLKKADEDYDEYVEKASILFNYITSQIKPN